MNEKTETKEWKREKTGFVATLFEEVIAKSCWVTFLLMRFVLRLTWKLAKAAWGIAKARMPVKEAVQGAVEQALKATPVVDEVIFKFEPAQAVLGVHEDEFSLYMRAFNDRIERTLKTDRERDSWMRARFAFTRTELKPFTREDAKQLGLAFTFGGAVTFTSREMAGRLPKRQVVEIREPDAVEHVQKTVLTKADSHEGVADDKSASTVEYTGKVIAAGLVDIRPEGRPAYTTFGISLKSSSGEIVELQGVELREKFEARHFDLYDVIHVIKSKTNFMAGKQKRTKNSFAVRVLEKAPV